MKKIFKNSFMALAVLALGFSACTEEVEYTPVQAPANDQVYFSNTNSAKIELLKEATSFEITLQRQTAGGELEVPITFDGDSLAKVLCVAPDFVKFDSAATQASYVIELNGLSAFVDGADGSGSGYDKFFNVSLAIDDTLGLYTTPYGDSAFAFEAGVPAPWSEWEKMTGVYNFSLYVSGAYPIPVLYREHLLDNTRAQFLLGVTEIGANEDITIEYNKETNACQVGIHYFLDNANYGPVFVSDFPHNPFDLNGDGYRETYEDNPCTYDPETGLFTLNLVYFVYTGLGSSASGTFGTGKETIQLDGFTQYDYSFSMQFKGNYVDNNGTNNAVISTTKGVDVAKYLMTVISADEDVTAAIQGMLKGEVACDTLTEAGFYAYPMTASGNYKVLAITFDAEENPLEAYSTGFEFWVAGDTNPWQSLGYAVYTDDVILPLYGNPAMSYYVEVLENKEQPGLFRLMDLCGPEYPFYTYGTYKEGSYIEIDATDPEAVWIEGWQSTGFDLGGGVIEMTSMAWYQANAEGATKEVAKEAGLCGTYADGVITFPADGILVAIGDQAYYGNRNAGFKLDMTDMLESLPAEAAASRSIAARMMMEIKAEAAGKVTRFKKIDNSFLTPTEFPLAD